MPISILIADDDALIREGLRIILQLDERFRVAGCVENGLKAVEFCLKEQVDVALLDVRMPVMTGLQAAAELLRSTATKPLILTTFDEDEMITGALKSGARGYLLKSSSPDGIKNAIITVHNGGTVMQDVIMDRIRDRLVQDSVPAQAAQAGPAEAAGRINEAAFTERELDIIRLIARGLSNKEIAGRLYMSEGTVKNYITSILTKTGFEHRTQIAIYYLTGDRKQAQDR